MAVVSIALRALTCKSEFCDCSIVHGIERASHSLSRHDVGGPGYSARFEKRENGCALCPKTNEEKNTSCIRPGNGIVFVE